MFSLFKSDPVKRLQKDYDKKLAAAMQAQRNGDIQSYSYMSSEADEILKQIESLEAGNRQA